MATVTTPDRLVTRAMALARALAAAPDITIPIPAVEPAVEPTTFDVPTVGHSTDLHLTPDDLTLDDPTDDLADVHVGRAETTARDFLAGSATLTLVELVERQSAFYAAWPTDAGKLIARELEALAGKIAMTGATTPADYDARIEILDADAREQHYRIGHEDGRESCRCRSYAFGHDV